MTRCSTSKFGAGIVVPRQLHPLLLATDDRRTREQVDVVSEVCDVLVVNGSTIRELARRMERGPNDATHISMEQSTTFNRTNVNMNAFIIHESLRYSVKLRLGVNIQIARWTSRTH